MITTQNVSNPKPVREINWLGNPIGPNESYYGPEKPNESPNESTPKPSVKRVLRKRNRVSAWTAEKRAAYGERMRQWHAKRKANAAQI